MAGPYGRICRDLFGQSLHIKGTLVLDKNAKLTVPNACVNNINVTGNVLTTGITEQEGQQGIRVIGNICLDEDYAVKSSLITETTPDQGVWIKKSIISNKFGFGRAFISSPYAIDKNGNVEQIIFDTKSFESGFTTTNNLIHNNANVEITFTSPSLNDLIAPQDCSIGNVIVDTKVQIQSTLLTGSADDTLTFMLTKNRNTSSPLIEYIYTASNATLDDTIQTFIFGDTLKLNLDDVIDVFVTAGNISGNFCANVNAGSSKSFASFNILSFEE